MIGVYFETWACPYTNNAADCVLSKMEKPIDIVFLSFAKPDAEYKKGQNNFLGTGLDFRISFPIVKQSIQILRKKGIKVMLAIGGATYLFRQYKPQAISDLCYDLDCDGIDIDWEPVDGVASSGQLGPIIATTRSYNPSKLLSMAGFSTGCFEPNGDTYRGMCIPGLKTEGSKLDFINIMAYDAGAGFDVIAAYESYKKYFSKHVMVGFEVGKQGWGDALLTMKDVVTVCNYITTKKDGCFVWAFFKDGTPSCMEVIQQAAVLLNTKSTCPCPNCGYLLTIN